MSDENNLSKEEWERLLNPFDLPISDEEYFWLKKLLAQYRPSSKTSAPKKKSRRGSTASGNCNRTKSALSARGIYARSPSEIEKETIKVLGCVDN